MDRVIRSDRGNALSCGSWMTEAPMRMLMNNLDPEVAKDPATSSSTEGTGRLLGIGRVMTGSSRR